MTSLLLTPFWSSHLLAAALTLVAACELRAGRIPTPLVAVAVGVALVVHDRAPCGPPSTA